MKRAILLLATSGLVLAGGAGQAWATPLTFTLNDTANGVSATAQFVAETGGFGVIVTNTLANTPDAGHAISQFQFTVGGSFTAPTAFTEIKGTATDFNSSPVAVDDHTSTNVVDHWGFGTSGSNSQVFDVGNSPAPGGQPNHLIVSTGSTPNASLTNTHLPSFIGSVEFFFTDTSGVPLTTSDITNFKFAFGTTPEVPLENADPPVATPEPSSLVLLAINGACLFGYGWRRHKLTQ